MGELANLFLAQLGGILLGLGALVTAIRTRRAVLNLPDYAERIIRTEAIVAGIGSRTERIEDLLMRWVKPN